MPQSAQHKAKISKGVKAYHACARSKGCGKKKTANKPAKKDVAKKREEASKFLKKTGQIALYARRKRAKKAEAKKPVAKKPVAKKPAKAEAKIYKFDWWYGGKLSSYLNDTMDSTLNNRRIGYKRVELATQKILNKMKKEGVKPTEKKIIGELNKKFPE